MDVQPPLLEELLGPLPLEAAEEFQGLGARRRFPAGTSLFLEGDPAHEVLVLTGGTVKVSVGSVEGHEVVLDVFEPKALLGELSVVDGGRRSATVTALTPVEVLTIAAGTFNDFLDRHPEVLRALMVQVIGRLRTRVRHQMEFGSGDAMGRICARLSELASRYGEAAGGGMLIRSPVTQSDMAAWTGLSREAVVKGLRALRRLGWIDNHGSAIVIIQADRIRHRAAQ